MRILLVSNPIAGLGSAARTVAALRRRLEARGHEVLGLRTGGPGHAERRVAALAPELDCIVSAGGDGTLNEVLNGLPRPDATPLVPLGLGTANMLVRELGLPRDPQGLARVIEAAEERRVDVGRAGPRRFLSLAGVGFDGLVTETLAGQRRGPLGYRGYVRPILRSILRYRPEPLRLRLDEGPEEACEFVVVSSIANYGGVLRLTPRARCDSGRFEVCRFRRASVPVLLGVLAPAVAGRLDAVPGVRIDPATRVRVEADASVPLQLDGDHRGTTPVSIAIEPGAARLLVPPKPRA